MARSASGMVWSSGRSFVCWVVVALDFRVVSELMRPLLTFPRTSLTEVPSMGGRRVRRAKRIPPSE